MSDKNRLPSDEVTFGKDELDLYYKIQKRCKDNYESKAKFYKKAVLEKLERESNPLSHNTYPQPMKTESYLPINQDGLNNMLDGFIS
ncbi:MAG: hypothetical protein K0S41_2039 [Anaerocolumna sp.]|jgi:hypothetical protein|nr:hypothetical protein [Anaerocolumna sp.]